MESKQSHYPTKPKGPRGTARRYAPVVLALSLMGLLGLATPAVAGAAEPRPGNRGISRVQNVEVEPGNRQLTVRWDEPKQTGRGIRSYMVEATFLIGTTTASDAVTDQVNNVARPNSGSEAQFVDLEPSCSAAATERTCVLRNLVNGVDYLVTVWAVGRRGEGPHVQTTGTPAAPVPMRRIVVNAKGERAEEEFEVRIGDTVLGKERTTHDYQRYEFSASGDLTGPVTVAFTNDYYDGMQIDRNLWVEWVGVGQLPKPRVKEPKDYGISAVSDLGASKGDTTKKRNRGGNTDKAVLDGKNGKGRKGGGLGADNRLIKIYSDQPNVWSEGAWTNGEGCSPGFRQTARITCGGTFTYGEINDNGTFTDGGKDPYLPELPEGAADPVGSSWLKVRAQGTVGGERFAVRFDGSAEILAQIVVTKEWRTYRIPVQYASGKPVIAFMNDMADRAHDFNLVVDWISFDGERFEAEDPAVWVNGTGSCESGNLQTETMYCNGSWWFPHVANI